METKEKIITLIEPVLAQHNMELVDLNVGKYRNKVIVQLFIDKQSGKIMLDDCQKMSEIIGGVLDMEQALTGAYVLEVSSPGVRRPLTKPEHFKKFKGIRIKLELKIPIENRHNFTGIIADSDKDGFTLDDGTSKFNFKYDAVKKVRLDPVLDF